MPIPTPTGLPTHDDFNPWGPPRRDNLSSDADWAWKNFGGLTLQQAHDKFRERPGLYQEVFMYMGGKAFAYYFPVLEDYLLGVHDEPNEDADSHEAWILARCFEFQLGCATAQHVVHLAPRMIALSQFVRSNLMRFGFDDEERDLIQNAWLELEQRIQAITNPGGS